LRTVAMSARAGSTLRHYCNCISTWSIGSMTLYKLQPVSRVMTGAEDGCTSKRKAAFAFSGHARTGADLCLGRDRCRVCSPGASLRLPDGTPSEDQARYPGGGGSEGGSCRPRRYHSQGRGCRATRVQCRESHVRSSQGEGGDGCEFEGKGGPPDVFDEKAR